MIVKRIRQWQEVCLHKGDVLRAAHNCIVFFSPYPASQEDAADGYFQRVFAVDALFPDRHKFYVHMVKNKAEARLFSPKPDTTVIYAHWTSLQLLGMISGAMDAAHVVYLQSVYNAMRPMALLLYCLCGKKHCFDFHGIVPEEMCMSGEPTRRRIHAAIAERIAVACSSHFVLVSEQMRSFLQNKYSGSDFSKAYNVPLISGLRSAPVANKGSRLAVGYAGGVQSWQQLPRVLGAVDRHLASADYFFCTPVPLNLEEMGFGHLRNRVMCASLPHGEVASLLDRMHYGFSLRPNSAVSRCACPIKLIEYLLHDIVPILDFPHIGDFVDMGMQYVPFADFCQHGLPDEARRMEMVKVNRGVLARFMDNQTTALQKLLQEFA